MSCRDEKCEFRRLRQPDCTDIGRIAGLRSNYAQLRPAFLHQRDNVAVLLDQTLELDRGKPLLECDQQFLVMRRLVGVGYRQAQTRLQPCPYPRRRLRQPIMLLKNLASVGEQGLAMRGETGLASRSIKERDADINLQIRND